jgi:hypothetical protein
MPDVTVTIGPIDVGLLREQRDHLLALFDTHGYVLQDLGHWKALDGILNLLDSMLDQADGFDLP